MQAQIFHAPTLKIIGGKRRIAEHRHVGVQVTLRPKHGRINYADEVKQISLGQLRVGFARSNDCVAHTDGIGMFVPHL